MWALLIENRVTIGRHKEIKKIKTQFIIIFFVVKFIHRCKLFKVKISEN